MANENTNETTSLFANYAGLGRDKRAAEALHAERPALRVLVGTEQQVAWAAQIRAQKLLDMEFMCAHQMDRLPETAEEWKAALQRAYRANRAAWWVDHRGDDGMMLLRTFRTLNQRDAAKQAERAR